MFRKPKKKEEKQVRQRLVDGEEAEAIPNDEQSSEDGAISLPKAVALVSFDHDEGADADFTLKKTNAKKVKELKRIAKMEDEAEIQYKMGREEQDNKKKERSAREQYLDKYRSDSYQEPKPKQEEHDIELAEDHEQDDTHSKFTDSLAGIPDSRAIFEAKKKRERMKNEGYIPLEGKNGAPPEKVARQRLVREDDNDLSDEDDHGRFYSSKELLRNEEDRRREEQNEFLEQEQGDDIRDPEQDEWEKQQILKAVSKHTIGQIHAEFRESRKLFTGAPGYPVTVETVDMEVDMDVEIVMPRPSAAPVNTGGVITLEDILAKLKLRIDDREEAVNTRRYDIDRMEKTLEENKSTIQRVVEISSIGDKRRLIAKSRTERFLRRRRRDIQDQYAECSAAASGKSINTVRTGEAATRAAEREARRARRRRMRETSLAGISHEEGLSSDDEETPSQRIIDDETIKESNVALDNIFIDAQDDYSSLRKVLERMVDWYAMDKKTFEEAYVHLCIPKMSSPYVRIELIKADILNNGNFTLASSQWYMDALLAGADRTDLDRESDIIVGIIPSVVEKVVIPFLIDVVNDELDPMSLRQCANLGLFLKDLDIFPTLNESSKPFGTLVEALKIKITNSIDEDLYTPMFGKQAIENPNTGCKSFLDRQFWSAIKLIRNINKFSSFFSTEVRFALVVENIVNKVCVLGIQLGNTSDTSCERKIRALIDELTPDLCAVGGQNSFRSLVACLKKVEEDMKTAGRDFYRDMALNVSEILTRTVEMIQQIPRNENDKGKKAALQALAELEEKIERANLAAKDFPNIIKEKHKDVFKAAENPEKFSLVLKKVKDDFLKDFEAHAASFSNEDLQLKLNHLTQENSDKDTETGADNDDTQDIDGTVTYVNKDPFTKKKIQRPLKNNRCGHVYDEESIKIMLEKFPAGIKCPLVGCGNNRNLTIEDLDFYPEFFQHCRD